jgi:hypothetical protein
MIKLIQLLSVTVLLSVLALIIIFVFNPLDLRTKIIGGIINSYLSGVIKDHGSDQDQDAQDSPRDIKENSEEAASDRHPLLNAEQEKALEKYGVNVSRLPSTISPEMEACFVEKLGKERTGEIVAGDSPTAMEVFKTRSCLGK